MKLGENINLNMLIIFTKFQKDWTKNVDLWAERAKKGTAEKLKSYVVQALDIREPHLKWVKHRLTSATQFLFEEVTQNTMGTILNLWDFTQLPPNEFFSRCLSHFKISTIYIFFHNSVLKRYLKQEGTYKFVLFCNNKPIFLFAL